MFGIFTRVRRAGSELSGQAAEADYGTGEPIRAAACSSCSSAVWRNSDVDQPGKVGQQCRRADFC